MSTAIRAEHRYRGRNHSDVRQNNTGAVLRAVHDLGPTTRIDLARRTGLNSATVTHIVDELIRVGLVKETGVGVSRVGRKPVHLEVVPSARFAVGLDLARNAITGAVIDLSGRVIRRVSAPTPVTGPAVLTALRKIVRALLDQPERLDPSLAVGIGIGVPGPISTMSGSYLSPPTFGSWHDVALVREVGDFSHLPTLVDNNANTSALAELWFGAGRGADDFVLLTLGTGVGAGLVLGGEVYHGHHGAAGELGHISIDPQGPRCACGNYGCLELYLSRPRLLASVRAALATGEPSLLLELCREGEEPTLEQFLTAVREGDRLSARIFADFKRHLVVAIVNIVNAFDPQLILIGRDLASAGELLLQPVRAQVRERLMPGLRDVRVEAATLPDAPVIGAGTLVLRRFFHAPVSPSRR